MDELDVLTSKLEAARKEKSKKKEINALLNLTEYHYNHEDFQKAKILCKQVLNLNKNQKKANYYLGLLEIQKGNFTIANDYLKKELRINPNNKKVKVLIEKIDIDSNLPVITILLFFLNSLIFYFIFPEISFSNLIKFALSHERFEFSTLISSIFFHMNTFHFLFNMLFLLMFGLILEKLIGSIKFLTIYLVSGIVGNMIQILLTSDSGFVLGASAAIFGIMGGLIMREPLLDTRLFGIIKMPIIILVGIFFIFSSLINTYFNLNSFSNGDIAHIFGLLAGILITVIMYRDSISIFYNWVIISIGFLLLISNIKFYFFAKDYLGIDAILSVLFYVFLSLFLIAYSYYNLKYFKGEIIRRK